MDRRNFLRFLGLGAAGLAAPTKTYSFLGGILRPRPEWTYIHGGKVYGIYPRIHDIARMHPHEWRVIGEMINPPLVVDSASLVLPVWT